MYKIICQYFKLIKNRRVKDQYETLVTSKRMLWKDQNVVVNNKTVIMLLKNRLDHKQTNYGRYKPRANANQHARDVVSKCIDLFHMISIVNKVNCGFNSKTMCCLYMGLAEAIVTYGRASAGKHYWMSKEISYYKQQKHIERRQARRCVLSAEYCQCISNYKEEPKDTMPERKRRLQKNEIDELSSNEIKRT